MSESPKLLDVVALTEPVPAENLAKGQVGTVVEILAENVFEIEFADRQGRTITQCALPGSVLLVLHYEAIPA